MTTGRKGVAVLKKFFELKNGQTLQEFAAETKELDDKSFEQLRDGIEDGTLTY